MDHHCRARRARPKRGAAWAALLALAALASACESDAPKEAAPAAPVAAPAPPAPAPKAAKPPAPPPVAVKALEWDDPPEWKRVKPSSSMRHSSYEVPPAKGDKGDKGITELNVFILGGEIEPNIQRWIDEFSGFDPKTLVRSDRTVNDMTQAIVEVPKGKFSGGMNTLTASENHGLLGAIVVTPEGVKYFFKMTGPSPTVKSARVPFYKMLDSMRLEGSKPAPASAIPAPSTVGKAPAPAAASAKSAPAGAAAAPGEPKAPASAAASPAAGAKAVPTVPEATPAKQ